MEGKLDLANERHDQTNKRLDNHEMRLHRHSNDISVLQAESHLKKGERQGFVLSGRILWAAAGMMTSGSVIALFKLFGN